MVWTYTNKKNEEIKQLGYLYPNDTYSNIPNTGGFFNTIGKGIIGTLSTAGELTIGLYSYSINGQIERVGKELKQQDYNALVWNFQFYNYLFEYSEK